MIARSMLRRLWPKSLAGKAGVAVVYLFLLYFVAWWRTSASLAAAWKLSDEIGLPNDVVALRGPIVPDDQNMALVLDRAAKIASEFLNAEMAGRDIEDERQELSDVPLRLPLVDSIITGTEYESQLRQAASMSLYYRPHNPRQAYEFSIGDYIQHRRSFARLEDAIVDRLEQTGRFQEAMERALRFHGLARRCLHGEPSLLEILSNDSVRWEAATRIHRLLRRYRFTPDIYVRIERELAATDQYTRLFTLSAQLGKFENVELYRDFLAEKHLAFITPLVNVESAAIIRVEHRRLLAHQLPFAEARDEMKRLDEEIERATSSERRAWIMRGVGCVGKHSLAIRVSCARNIAWNRCLRVVNAMARRKDFNAELASLGLSDECLTDPFNGQRLRVKRDSDGPTVYSVGENVIDDGGDVYRWGDRKDVGLGPIRQPPVQR